MSASDFNTTREAKGDTDNTSLLARARADWDRAFEKEKSNISAAYEDLEFLAGGGRQWDAKIRQEREAEGRPCLEVNQLPQFVHQVTGDIRQMRPAIKVVPVDDGADEKVADLLGGLVRYIENRSDAAGVYFQAADQQVGAGIGHWRVTTEYAADSTYLQEIRIAPVDDGIAVLWDPDSRQLMREDARYCFVPVDYSTEGFKQAFPDAQITDFNTLATWPNLAGWYTDSHVRVAEYWVKEKTKRTLALTQEGQTLDLTDEDDGKSTEEQIAIAKAFGAKIEERETYKVVRYLMTAGEILEGPEDWDGRHIPIVPVVGEEVKIGRKVVRKGIVRDAKPVQQMYNYGRSTQTEVFSLQPKAPFMVTELNVAKYQDLWNTANRKNWPYLVYTPDRENGGKEPSRIQPPVASQGVNEAVALANEDLRRVIGIYDASLGAKSNETSGVAIRARQKEGDTGTIVYVTNFSRAIRRTGQILVDLIPHVYDTERTIRIMGEDGKIDLIQINQMQKQANPKTGELENVITRDVTVGAYDVVAEAGPSYTTRREEARDGMLEFLKAIPTAAPLVADKIAKAQDFPMADDIAKRLRAGLPPQILEAEDAEQRGASPEEIKQIMAQGQQKPPDPALVKVQLDAQIRQAEQQAAQQKAAQDAQIEALRLQQAAQQSQRDYELKQMELSQNAQLERERMALDSQTKIEIAQINAGVGMHKVVVQAGTDHTATMVDAALTHHATLTDAAVKAHQIDTAASTAQYATDNRPTAQ